MLQMPEIVQCVHCENFLYQEEACTVLIKTYRTPYCTEKNMLIPVDVCADCYDEYLEQEGIDPQTLKYYA